ncbi:MAG: AraC family transcriptional regulator [Cyanobacteria bacterium J06627_8]
MKPYRYEQNFGSVVAVYGRQPSSKARLEPTISALNCIDFAFIGHTGTLVRLEDGPTFARHIPAGTGGIHGDARMEFVQVDGPSEFIELVPSPDIRLLAANNFKAPDAVNFDEIQQVDDQVLWAVASRFRAHAMGGWTIDTLEAEVLILGLVGHLMCRYLGGKRPRVNERRLPAKTLTQLRDYIEASLDQSISVTDLAQVAHRSPYHFMRTFTSTTGIKPHQFVQAIRMERAKKVLLNGASVKMAARTVGYVPGHSFRKTFYQYFGMQPSVFAKAIL